MPSSNKPKVALIDSNIKDRQLILRYSQCYFILEEFSSLGEFLTSKSINSFRGVIYDPHENGERPQTNIIPLASKNLLCSTLIVSRYDDARFAVCCLKGGAVDYIFKPFSEKNLVEGLDALQEKINSHIRENVFERLTAREKDVCELIASGLSTKEIARVLDISPRTVDVHRAKILAKVGVSNSPQLIIKRNVASY
jgi:FixJ family two-component response regulator